jgi:hypothetical protein
MIAIVIPTIPGREDSLERTIASYERFTSCEHEIVVYPDSPSSGAGWLNGSYAFVDEHGTPDYIHLTNDDCEAGCEDWWKPCVSACDQGTLPAPIVRNPDGSLQSAGGQIGAPGNLLHEIGRDWSAVGFTTVPFLSWAQWERIGMLPVHYASDVWISHRGRQLGVQTVLRHGYEIVHHNHPVGRGAGMSQGARDAQDRAIVEEALAR